MSGVLRLSNTAGGTGRSTVISEAIDDQTYILPVNGGVLITGGSSSELVFPSGTEALPGLQVQGDADTGLYAPAANTLAISTGAEERLRVDSDGRLLIGTSSARSVSNITPNLQIEGNTLAKSSLTVTNTYSLAESPNIILSKTRNGSIVQDDDVLGTIAFAGDDGSDLNTPAALITAVVDGTPGSNDMPGRLVFSTTADGASSPTERMRIDSSGRVGIGTDTPEQRLHVLTRGTLGGIIAQFENNDLDNFGGLRILGGITDRECRFQSLFGSSSFTFYTEGTGAAEERMRIDSSGRVGINQSSPDTKLDVNGAFFLRPTAETFPAENGVGMRLRSDTNHFQIQALQYTPAVVYYNIDYLGLRHRWHVNGSEKMQLDAQGRLLLGTTTEGVGGGDQFTIGVTGNNNAGMTIRSGTSTRGSIYFSDGTSGAAEYDGYIEYDQADRYMRFGTGGGNQRLRINSNGISLFSSTQGAIQIGTGVFTGNNTFVDITPWSNVGNLSGGGSILVLLHNHTGTTGGTSALYQIYINFNGVLGATTQISGGLSFDADVNAGILRFKSFDGGTGLSTTMGYSLIYSDPRLHTPD